MNVYISLGGGGGGARKRVIDQGYYGNMWREIGMCRDMREREVRRGMYLDSPPGNQEELKMAAPFSFSTSSSSSSFISDALFPKTMVFSPTRTL